MDDEIDEIEKLYNYKFHDRDMVKIFQEIIPKIKDENMLIISVDVNYMCITAFIGNNIIRGLFYKNTYLEYRYNYEQRKNYLTDISVLASFNDIIIWIRPVDNFYWDFIIENTFNIKILLRWFNTRGQNFNTVFDAIIPIFANLNIKLLIINGDWSSEQIEYLSDLPFSVEYIRINFVQ